MHYVVQNNTKKYLAVDLFYSHVWISFELLKIKDKMCYGNGPVQTTGHKSISIGLMCYILFKIKSPALRLNGMTANQNEIIVQGYPIWDPLMCFWLLIISSAFRTDESFKSDSAEVNLEWGSAHAHWRKTSGPICFLPWLFVCICESAISMFAYCSL
jgi:hypothetical protein